MRDLLYRLLALEVFERARPVCPAWLRISQTDWSDMVRSKVETGLDQCSNSGGGMSKVVVTMSDQSKTRYFRVPLVDINLDICTGEVSFDVAQAIGPNGSDMRDARPRAYPGKSNNIRILCPPGIIARRRTNAFYVAKTTDHRLECDISLVAP